jgi:hypothetical protein
MPLSTNRTTFTFNHADQVDEYGASVGNFDTVQTNFDSRAEQNLTDINDIKDTLASETVGDSGAHNIKSAGIAGILSGAAATIYAMLSALKTYVDAAQMGQILDGSLDDVKLSNTAGQIKDRFTTHEAEMATKIATINDELAINVVKKWDIPKGTVITDGLVYQYEFNEGVGTTIINKAGAGNLTITGSNTADVWNGVAPDGSKVAKFFGNNKAVIGAPSALGDKFTIMVAFKTEKIAAEAYLFERAKTTTADGKSLVVAFRGDAFANGNNATINTQALQADTTMKSMQHLMAGTGADVIGKWHMFTITRDGDYIREFINGVLLTQYKSKFNTLEGGLHIGNAFAVSSLASIQGYIGLYLEYTRALSDSEILLNTGIFADRFQYTMQTEERRIINAHNKGLPSKPVLIPTYEGSGETIHPSVEYFRENWNNYKFWMANTPYPTTIPALENPSVFASLDGIDWFIPAGLTNPVEPDTVDITNADTELFYNSATNELWLYFVQWPTDLSASNFYRRKSADGVTWGAKELVIAYPWADRDVSPVILKPSSDYLLYSVNFATNTIKKRSGTDGLVFGLPQDCVLTGTPVGESQSWHIDVVYDTDDSKYYLFDAKAGGNILMYESIDGINFAYVTTLLRPTTRDDANIPFLSHALYRPTVVKLLVGHYYMWFGVLGVNENRTAMVDIKRINNQWQAVPIM